MELRRNSGGTLLPSSRKMASPYLMLFTLLMTLALINVSEASSPGGQDSDDDASTVYNECLTLPCKNNGTCLNLILGGYQCLCAAGWTNVTCNSDINECDSKPCQNGAICSNTIGSYICKCPAGYINQNCSSEILACKGYSFFFGGSVLKTGHGYYTKSQAENLCQQNGATLPRGSSDIATFAPVTPITSSCVITFVQNFINSSGANGVAGNVWSSQCKLEPHGKFICNMWVVYRRRGHTSSFYLHPTSEEGNRHFIYPVCQKDIDECDSKPCQNGGTCINTNGSYICKCVHGWAGINCSFVNECLNLPCQHNGTCLIKRLGGYQCLCAAGWTNFTCNSDINECDSKPCQNGATCSNTKGSYICNCPAGYNNRNCSSEILACKGYSFFFGGSVLKTGQGHYTKSQAENLCLQNGATLPLGSSNLAASPLAAPITSSCVFTLVQNFISSRGANGEAGYVWSNQCKLDHRRKLTCYLWVVYPRNDHTSLFSINPNTKEANEHFIYPVCQKDIDECNSKPCQSGETCTNTYGSYICKCPAGYDGNGCSSEVLECKGHSFFFGDRILKTGQGHYTQSKTQNLCQQYEAKLPSGFLHQVAPTLVAPTTSSCVIKLVQDYISSHGANGEDGNVWSNQCFMYGFGLASVHICNFWIVYGRGSTNARLTNLHQQPVSDQEKKHFIYPVCQKGPDTTCRAFGILPAGRFASSNVFSYKPLSHGTVLTAGSQLQAIDICSQNGGDIPHFVPHMCPINVRSPEVLPYTRDTDRSQIPRTVVCQRPVQICKGFGTLQVPRGHDFRRMVTYNEAKDLCRSEPIYNFALSWQFPQSEACMNKLLDRMQAVFKMHQRPQVWYHSMSHVQGKRAVVCWLYRSNEFFQGAGSHIGQYSYSKMWTSQP